MSLEIPLSIARSDGRIPLVFAWGVSSFFGWGVYGMNLALALADHPAITPLTALPFGRGDVVVDPLRMYRLMRVADASRVLWDALAAMPTPWVSSDTPVLHPLHETLATNPVGHERMLSGRPDIGVIFFHNTRITAQAQDNARRFPLIVAGSSWAEAVLRANTIAATTTVIQGVDISLFHPAPRAGWFPGRFVIFSETV
jgi:hypothetical protein